MRKLAPIVSCALLAGCAGGVGAPKVALDLSRVEPALESYTDQDLLHLRYLLTEDQQAEYRSLPPGAERTEMMRIVWEELDPTPTTEINERRLEHFRRLGYVQKHFTIKDAPGWDRRGELLLRYGVPDQRRETPPDIVEGLGAVPGKEIWVYRTLGQAYRLEDPLFQGNFQDSFELAGVQKALTPRSIDASRDARQEFGDPTIRDRAQRTDLDDIPDAEAALMERKLENLLARGQEAYRDKPQAYVHDYGGEQLPMVYDVVNFEGVEGKTHLEINTAFWASDLEYMPEGNRYVAVLGTQAAVKTLDYREVARTDEVTRDRKDSIDDLAGRLVLAQVRLDLEPGDYRLALSVRDSLSGNLGLFKKEIAVRDLSGSDLRMSDVQRALDVRGGKPGDPFLRGPLQVVPYPLETFPRERDIYLYFEAYGLELSPEGDVFYGVDFLIKPRAVDAPSWFGSSKGRVVPGIASTFEGTGKSSTVREHIIFDPSTFTDDIYDVEITVHDRINDRSTSRSVSFKVQGR